jgi:hypothetical protein
VTAAVLDATLPGTVLPSGYRVSVQIGVGRSAQAGVWDSPGWDEVYWADPETTLGDWVDITCYVVDFAVTGGASAADGILTRWEGRTASLTLAGDLWNPWSGPYAGLLTPALPVQILWAPPGAGALGACFVGSVDEGGWNWDPRAKRASVALVDQTAILQAWDGLEQAPVGFGEVASARVARILDAAEWPAADRNILPSTLAVRDTTLAGKAWEMLLTVADTDLALCWVNRAGLLVYVPLGRAEFVQPQQPVTVDARRARPAGSYGLVNMTMSQPQATRNIVSISRQGQTETDAVTVTLRDNGSVARYRPHTYTRTDLIHIDDSWSTTVAQQILATSAWPHEAVTGIDLDTRYDARVGSLLLGWELGNRVTVIDLDGDPWPCAVLGGSVSVSRSAFAGSLILDDATRYIAGTWDAASWDIDTWGV